MVPVLDPHGTRPDSGQHSSGEFQARSPWCGQAGSATPEAQQCRRLWNTNGCEDGQGNDPGIRYCVYPPPELNTHIEQAQKYTALWDNTAGNMRFNNRRCAKRKVSLSLQYIVSGLTFPHHEGEPRPCGGSPGDDTEPGTALGHPEVQEEHGYDECGLHVGATKVKLIRWGVEFRVYSPSS